MRLKIGVRWLRLRAATKGRVFRFGKEMSRILHTLELLAGTPRRTRSCESLATNYHFAAPLPQRAILQRQRRPATLFIARIRSL